MSTKATIQTLINENLADSSSITASEHREVENSLLNELYGTSYVEKHNLTNGITLRNLTILTNEFNVTFLKQGSRVSISGFIKNNSSNIYGGNVNSFFIEIIDSDYFPRTNQSPISIPTSQGSIEFDFTAKKIYTTFIGANATVNFQLTYFTAN